MRLLVTGSREWDHLASVAEVLAYYTRQAHALHHRLTVVHGKAHGGADMLAAAWVHRWGGRGWPVREEPYPANWGADCVPECSPHHRQRRGDGSEYCPYAGFRRNQQMVDTRPDLCVGFWRNSSSGTRDCIRRAEKAGIPVLKVLWQQREGVHTAWLGQNAPKLGEGKAL